MELRTQRSSVTFTSDFFLHGFAKAQPPGEYRIESDEEQLDGLTFIAFRRIATYIHLPALTTGRLASQIIEIDPADLEKALAKDRAT